MDRSTKLFFSGIIVAFVISIFESLSTASHPDDPYAFLIYSVSSAGTVIKFSYFTLLIVILPLVTIPRLKKKLGSKSYSVYAFAAGITLWGGIEGISMLLTS